jgi:hypothetical protein
MSIIANSSGLVQDLYSLSQENINTFYRIFSGLIGVCNYGSTFYYIGDYSDNRCA